MKEKNALRSRKGDLKEADFETFNRDKSSSKQLADYAPIITVDKPNNN